MPDNDKIERSKTPTLEGCPMPGCGGECFPSDAEGVAEVLKMKTRTVVYCRNIECQYRAPSIAAHNRLCKRARLGKLVEKVKENPPEDGGIHFGGTNRDQIHAFNRGRDAVLDMLTLPVEDTEPRGMQSDSEVKEFTEKLGLSGMLRGTVEEEEFKFEGDGDARQ